MHPKCLKIDAGLSRQVLARTYLDHSMRPAVAIYARSRASANSPNRREIFGWFDLVVEDSLVGLTS